jgi:selenocysteine lyase/cysteine desulfurase
MTTPPHARAASAPREELAAAVAPAAPASRPWSRRELLALGIVALPAAGLLAARDARAQDFTQVPIPPDAARADPLDDFWDSLPREFPGGDELRYFNTAGLGIPPFEVLERTHAVAIEAATHGETMRHPHLDQARAAVARLVGADPDEIALMRNATEAMNVVARGLDLARGDEVILTTHEHPGGAAPWVARAQDEGIVLRLFTPSFDAGRDAEALWTLAGKRTRAIMVSHVLCTVGAVMPVEALCAEARRRRIWSVIDGAQAAGSLPLDLHALGADCYLASGHKWLLGPLETGFLYVRRDRLPQLHTRYAGAYAADDSGWSLRQGRLQFLDVASRFEYGTRSPAQAAGLAAAIDWQSAIGFDLAQARARALAQRFRAGIVDRPGIEVLTPAASAASPIVTFRIPRRPNTQVVEWLQRELGMRLRLVNEEGLNAVRAAFHLVDRRADVDWLSEAVRVLAA